MSLLSTLESAVTGNAATPGTASATASAPSVASDVTALAETFVMDLLTGKTIVAALEDVVAQAGADAVALYQRQLAASISAVPVPVRPAKAASTLESAATAKAAASPPTKS